MSQDWRRRGRTERREAAEVIIKDYYSVRGGPERDKEISQKEFR